MWEEADMILTKEELTAALRQKHGAGRQEAFEQAAVAVCGLGGLGSNVAAALARAGVGRLILIDFDRVEITNLQRQQYKASQIGRYKTGALAENLREIAPYVRLETHTVRIGEDNAARLLQDAGVVCEALDRAEDKAMLANIVLEAMPEKYLVAASGMAGFGSPNLIRTRRVAKRFYLCGDETSDADDEIGLFSARVMLCAAHQAHTVLRILAQEYEV